jgi:hypothetical protein
LLKESDDDEEAEDAKSKMNDNRSQKTNKSNRKESKRSERASSTKAHDAWIQENENEDPLDLLDPMAIKRVLATKPLTKEEILNKKLKEQENKSKNRGFKTTSDGRLVIEDDENDNDENDDRKSKIKSKTKKPDQLDEMMDTLSISKKSSVSKKSKQKRALDADDSDDEILEESKSRFSYRAGGSGIHRKLNNKKENVDYGAEYRAKV